MGRDTGMKNIVVNVDTFMMNPIGLEHLLEVDGCEDGLYFNPIFIDFGVENILIMFILRCDG